MAAGIACPAARISSLAVAEGMKNRNALVLGATGGIGAALLGALGRSSPVTGLSRRDGLDWTEPERAGAVLDRAIEQAGPFDLVITATGSLQPDGYPAEKKLAAIQPSGMAAHFAINAIGPALALARYDALLLREGRSVFATLSARVGSIGDNQLGGWISYRASKAALNQIVRTAAIEIARKRPEAVCVALHPGTVATPLSERYAGDRETLSPAEAAEKLLWVIGGLGPEQSGSFFAYDGEAIPW